MTVDDLRERAEEEQARQQKYRHRVFYCAAAGCVSCGSNSVRDAFGVALKARGLENEVEVIGTGCMGLCGEGPLVRIAPDNTLYQHVDSVAAETIVAEHIAGGKKVGAHLVDTTSPFFASQLKIVWRTAAPSIPKTSTATSLPAATRDSRAR
jgi:(2Fe-2S) ferredoxin